ncbi:MAG: hypothetical protein SWC96_01355 [Thermodesulfobacteriota bacterium]|nr:hypothetical protein [Thermodesulfobacteriota bacterium]
MIKIPLDLSKHCIQTETKRVYNRLLSTCLKPGTGPDTLAEQKLELLQQALETWDFAALRAAYPELAGGREAAVVLVTGPAGRLRISLNGRILPV